MKNEQSAEVLFSKIYYLFIKENEYVNKNELSPDLEVVLMVL